jgi:predicted permease
MSIAAPRARAGAARPRELVMIALLRNVVSPALALALGRVLALGRALGLGQAALLAVVAMAALPTAQNVLVYATRYGRGQGPGRDAGMLTTALAVPVLLVIAAMLG